LITVRIVAPAPGKPPISPAAMLPMPWPISSRSDLCRVRVIESATSDVNRLSIEPRSASTSAAWTIFGRSAIGKTGITRSGNPVGTSPMTGALGSNSTLISVPRVRAASGGGRTPAARFGQKIMVARLATAIARASGFSMAGTSGHARIEPSGPPGAVSMPKNGRVWMTMMMMPIPDMKPETTE
jgi:hypothetical protein